MSSLIYDDRRIEVAEGETVLSALLRAGVDAPHSCRAGVCQTCIHRAVAGEPPAEAQIGLSDAQKALGYFLTCVCVPKTPLTIVRASHGGARLDVVVSSIETFIPDIVRLRVETASSFVYRPGQFLELIASDDLKRHYSLASHPEEDPFLEMHIRLHENGRMSRHLSEQLAPGSQLKIVGPSGTCFYEGVDADQPLVLIGSGTGLSPLWGVLRDALRRGHRGPIRLYHGARNKQGLYLVDELETLAKARDNFSYRSCLLDPAAAHGGDLAATVVQSEAGLKDTAFFLCGGESLVGRLKRDLFLRGANLAAIRSDVFIPAAGSISSK
jgi:CDP-4-dehydro-6-deoxyglucose reductase